MFNYVILVVLTLMEWSWLVLHTHSSARTNCFFLAKMSNCELVKCGVDSLLRSCYLSLQVVVGRYFYLPGPEWDKLVKPVMTYCLHVYSHIYMYLTFKSVSVSVWQRTLLLCFAVINAIEITVVDSTICCCIN